MAIKIKNKFLISLTAVFFLVVLLVIGKNSLPAALSNVNVFVPDLKEVQTGGGGSYYVTTPQNSKNQPVAGENINKPGSQPLPQVSVTTNNIPANPVTPNQIQQNISNIIPAQVLENNSVAGLSVKFPQLGNILQNLGISKIASLQGYNFFLPGLKEITGGNSQQTNKIPQDIVFATAGKQNIDITASLDFSGTSAEQKINILSGKLLRLVIRPQAKPQNINGEILYNKFNILKFQYSDPNGSGVYFADINAPIVEGQYEILTSLDYGSNSSQNKQIKTITLVDPEGYIYENLASGELRIKNAIVSLYQLDINNKYNLWPAKDYAQENPQTTDSTGKYSFLVPQGTYYLEISAPGYKSYKSAPFSVQEGKEIHSNIALEKKINLYSFLNWNNYIFAIIFCLLVYNFYRDMQLRKLIKKKNLTK
jgi:hypothetical protein